MSMYNLYPLKRVAKSLRYTFFVVVLISLFFSTNTNSAFAEVEMCADLQGIQKDNCIEENAQSIQDCNELSFSATKNDCINRIIATFTDYQQCDSVNIDSKADCYSLVTFNNYPNELEKCYDIPGSYQGNCVKTYVSKNGTQDLDYCVNVREIGQRECAMQAAFNAQLNVEQSSCSQYVGKIKEGCLDYVANSKLSQAVLFGIGGFFFFLTLLPSAISLLSAIVTYLIVKKMKLTYPPGKDRVIAGLLINLTLLPGVGTILSGKTKLGFIQAIIYSIGLLLTLLMVGIPIQIIVRIWAIITSAQVWNDYNKIKKN